jgi:hypothetical protein
MSVRRSSRELSASELNQNIFVHRVRREFVNIPPCSALSFGSRELLCMGHNVKLFGRCGGGTSWAEIIGYIS